MNMQEYKSMTSDLRDLSVRAVDCLKFIYKIDERGERVTTSTMRERLQALEPDGQLSDATVTQLFKSLAEKGYVEHVPYRGVTLSERGRLAAAELVRHHRLLELYLARAMDYSLDAVDAEAERLEHAISEEFEDRVDALLGHPTEDPHGDPIPSKTGEVVLASTQPLSELEAGQTARVRRVRDDDAALLRYLATLGLVPGAEVCVRERAQFGGPLRVRVGGERDGEEHALGPQVAAGIRVAPN
jgi:DtxR family transcriptional regulator, Mn-dependent transcriptional regulator